MRLKVVMLLLGLFLSSCVQYDPVPQTEEIVEVMVDAQPALVAEVKETLIVIDPGHGGLDGGAVSDGGLAEKDIVLQVAYELERVLESFPRIRVELTRRDDLQVPLAERTALANALHADIFVSLHVNASGRSTASGFEAYYLDVAGDRAARRLANIENQSDAEEVDDLQFILSDLVQSGKLKQSIVLAHLIEREVVDELQGRWPQVKSHGVKKAPFYVLMGAHMPCVLLEMFFMDNPDDERLLKQSAFRTRLSKAIAKGIMASIEGQG
jgi:N-acetylmuramoyl-L-alanine amidase